MSDTYSLYDLSTGIFTGVRIGGSGQDWLQSLPAGLGAYPGEHDHRRVRVNVPEPALVPYQPPAPPDDTLQTWAWDAQAWRWVATPTAAALALQVRAERDRRLAACDWRVARAMETLVPLAPAWLAYRQALRDVPEQAGFPATVTWPAEPAA